MNFKVLEVMKMGSEFIEIGTYKITIHSPQMQMPITDEGKYLTIWEKKGKGDLKIKIEIWNTDVNPMTMMEKVSKEKKTLEGAKPDMPNEEKP
jgi:ketosteroid isomerase-like protein